MFWKVLTVVGGLGAAVQTLQYIESYWEKGQAPPWLRMIASVDQRLPAIVLFIVILALLYLGLRRLEAMNSRITNLAQTSAKEALNADFLEEFKKEVRTKAEENRRALGFPPSPISSNTARNPLVKSAEDHLRSLGLPDKHYRVINNDGTPQDWTRKQLDDLADQQRERLFTIHPDLQRWWLGAEKTQ